MNILLLAPHPFYQDRGTPIRVNLVSQVLSERGEQIDVVTYHEGETITYNNVNIYRIPNISFIRNIRPGLSWKKLICDFIMFPKVILLASRKRYRVVHAVEESVFMALVLKLLFKIPYVYHMDSSLAQQVIEKFPIFTPLRPMLNFFEGLAVKNSKAVAPVCDSLAQIAEKYGPKKVIILYDVSLLKDAKQMRQNNLKKELGISSLVLMYVGNLEGYQGIDLLLKSFALVLKETDKADLVIIGGALKDIQKYKKKSVRLGINNKVHFLGPRPIENLGDYLFGADILISPRIKGKNTPQKIYSYLHSGRALLATDLLTHTQVLDGRVSVLAAPYPEEFSKGMRRLIENEDIRLKLGEAGKKLVEEKYRYESFKEKLNGLYDWLEREVATRYAKEGS